MMKEKKFHEYFSEVRKTYLNEDYSELSFRTCFETFIESLDDNFDLHQEGTRTDKVGVPDFKAFRNSAKIGYMETKDINKDLDDELKSDQIKKYTNSINNLILTNYCRFIFIRKNQTIFDLTLFNKSDLNNPKFSIPEGSIKEFLRCINEFFGYKPETIRTAEELARELSKKARLLEQLAKEQLEEDISKTEGRSSIYDFYEVLNELIKDITVDECVDSYAQTITYGLFLSKTDYEGDLDRNTAASHIKKSVGLIKKIFENISGDHLPSKVSWIIDEIIDLLNASDIKKILEEIDFRGKKDRDPFTFFYEDFLNLYDPQKRKHLGVYYTPRPVVSFIVNSINLILKEDFNRLNGFADGDVKVLDPAVGTGTFLWLVYLVTLNELKERGQSAFISNKIEEHILKHFYGFELLITPYIIAHLKLTTILKKWNYRLKENDRIPVYLTNTLEPTEVHGLLPFMREISEENRIANKVKNDRILVVLGNPPYSVSSSNKSDWIKEKMQDYKKDLNERNIQPLDDDYIKFIRFGHWKIEQNGQGVLGFITNNSYLDGIIHRQMRKSLLDTFDRIYILNLHGSARIDNKLPPNISKDENVFNIQQGVAIALFVKNDKFKDKKVLYANLYGKREDKYQELDRNNVIGIGWQELKPQEPYYFFTIKDFKLLKDYESFYKIDEIFKLSNVGCATGKDNEFVSFSMDNFKNTNKELIKEYSYRIFDNRYVIYDIKQLQRARYNLMRHLEKSNIALVTTRFLSSDGFRHVGVTDKITDRCYISSKTKEANYIFPLYTYERNEKEPQKNLSNELLESVPEKHPNFTKEFLEFIEKQYPDQKITPKEILGYIYAMLHLPTYRQLFEEFLKIDFPRIPFAKDYESFKKRSDIGTELINLHLMKNKLETSTRFEVEGSNIVESVKYQDGKVYINKNQFFDRVPEDAWNFYIGGYQVLDKWLKSRKDRKLSIEEMEHFLQVVEVIKKTIEYTKKIGQG